MIQIPSPGAVCPAMVRLSFVTMISEAKLILPLTSNTMVLAPDALQASRKLPGPLSFKLVTLYTSPPLPPDVYLPKPSAPGNAGV